MPQPTIRRILTLFALALVSATIVLAQPAVPLQASDASTDNPWKVAQIIGSSKSKLLVLTVDQPHRRQTCRVQAFTVDKLVCSRAVGPSRVYLPQQVLALILPSDRALKLRLVLGLNGGVAAAVWGTVVLAATCPACATATGVVAVLLIGAAGAILIGDEQPERLLYLAAGQQLTGNLRSIQAL